MAITFLHAALTQNKTKAQQKMMIIQVNEKNSYNTGTYSSHFVHLNEIYNENASMYK